MHIQAPLLSLVPVPAFAMEVKTFETTINQTKSDTDSSATYNIHAYAVQQPSVEGMDKLTKMFS